MLHGGRQQYENSGFRWTKTAGFGGYAPSNNLILLIPQVEVKENSNPFGCWDFGGWGTVSDSNFEYATKQGVQAKAIKAMIDKLRQPLESNIVVENYFDGYSDWTDDWEYFMREYVRDLYQDFVYFTQWPWMLAEYLWIVLLAYQI